MAAMSRKATVLPIRVAPDALLHAGPIAAFVAFEASSNFREEVLRYLPAVIPAGRGEFRNRYGVAANALSLLPHSAV